MNDRRRKELYDIIDKLESLINNEQESFDNMPENLQFSEKGEKLEENIDSLTEARDIITTVAET